MSKDKREDTRSTEEIMAAQRGLLKILAVATFIPNVWIVFMSWNGYNRMAEAPYGDQGFAQFIVFWGLASPVIWLACYGYTFFQVGRQNMKPGAYLPVIPALWFIFWFAIQFVRQSDWIM